MMDENKTRSIVVGYECVFRAIKVTRMYLMVIQKGEVLVVYYEFMMLVGIGFRVE